MPSKNIRAVFENLPPATTSVCASYKHVVREESLRKSPSRVGKKVMVTPSM